MDVKQHFNNNNENRHRAQELCESRRGRPGFPSLWTSSNTKEEEENRDSNVCLAQYLTGYSIKETYSSRESQSPGEIKRREVSWTLTRKLAQKRSRAGRWCFCCSGGGPRQPWSSGWALVSRSHSSVPLFPVPTRPSRPRGR